MALHTTVQGTGNNLFLIHGWAMSSLVFDNMAKQLALRFCVTCVDLPGHGLSELDNGFGLDEVLEALFEVAPDQAVWIGWSLGGMLALEAALKKPQGITSLVLLATSARFVVDNDWTTAMPVEVLQAFAQGLQEDCQQTLKRFFSLVARDADNASQLLRQFRSTLLTQQVSAKALLGGLYLLRDIDLRTRMSQLKQCVLLLAGARDKLVPLAAVEALTIMITNAELKVVDGAGHAPFLSHPKPVVESIEQWLM